MCERWRLHLDGKQTDGWFADWVQRRPADVSVHLTAGFYAYLSLQLVYGPGELRSVREYFGGMGAQALMIQEGIRPEIHTVLDRSASSVAHLRRVLGGRGVRLAQADSYAPESYAPADLVGLDFGDLTAWRLRPGQPQRELLDRVFSGQPKAVVLTDVAGPRLHLHRERYGGVLEAPVPDHPAYLRALHWWFQRTYGYMMLRGYYHRWSAVLALVPVGRAPSSALLPVPDRPVGLELR